MIDFCFASNKYVGSFVLSVALGCIALVVLLQVWVWVLASLVV